MPPLKDPLTGMAVATLDTPAEAGRVLVTALRTSTAPMAVMRRVAVKNCILNKVILSSCVYLWLAEFNRSVTESPWFIYTWGAVRLPLQLK
jgi:hypothetical protein